jgi:hypothetical protein
VLIEPLPSFAVVGHPSVLTFLAKAITVVGQRETLQVEVVAVAWDAMLVKCDAEFRDIHHDSVPRQEAVTKPCPYVPTCNW